MPKYDFTEGQTPCLIVDGEVKKGWRINQNGDFYTPSIYGLNLQSTQILAEAKQLLINKWENG